ncbi:retrovirus-related pol polyprotein from transposon TNT 1-94 [Tanacetum coccineum]
MSSTSPIFLMAHATSIKSWLWHQRLSHLNFDIINDLAKNDLVTSLPKFRYHKEHLCPSCEEGKSKKASHPPKPVPNSKQRSKDEAPEEIKIFLKKIIVLLQAPIIIVRTDNGTEFKNQVLQEYFNSVGISHQAAEAIATACYTQNRSIIHLRFNKTPYELINGRKPNISFLHVFGALYYPKNECEDIGKLGAKGLDLTYASSTITTQKPTERELDLLFEALYDEFISGQLSVASRTIPVAQVPQVRHTPTTSTTTDVDELEPQQQHIQQQENQAPLQPKIVADNVSNVMLDGNTFVNPFAPPSTSAAESSSS